MTEIGQAAWLCRSHLLGCISTWSRVSFTSKNLLSILSHSGNGCWSQPLVIYIRYTQAKWVVGHVWLSCKMFLLNSVYSPLEIYQRKVIPYLVIIGKSITQYVLAVLIVYICGTWDANVPLDCYLLDLDIIIISKEFWYKDKSSVWILIREKPVPCYTAWSYEISFSFWNCFKLFTHTSPMTDPEFICFVLPKLLGA